MTLNNPETIEINGLKTIHKLCNFAADRDMEGCTFTEIVERMFAELEKAKAQAVPDTHVLVEKSKVHKWYQDANEPESFSNDDSEDGLRSLGDLIDDYGIMEVEIHESALISTKKAFGVWKSKSPTDICTNFVLVETLEEAEKILADNKAMYESESGAEG